MKRTGDAIYARYSSELQNPRSIDDQIVRLRGEVERYDGRADDSLIFSDGETSGGVWDRRGLQDLLRAVEQGRVKRIFCEDVSRISRDPEDQARLRKRLEYHGVQLVSVDGIELDGSSRASLSFGVKALFAEQYLRDLGDKTRRGLWGNAREGKATGGRTYGYVTGEGGKIAAHPEQASIVRVIFERYATGLGYAKIAAELNAKGIEPPRGTRRDSSSPRGWIASCIREMLRNPKYVGRWSFGAREWRRHPETRRRVARDRSAAAHTEERPELAIIDHDLWEAVQARLAVHAQARRDATAAAGRTPRKPTSYLLTSLLRCGCCGSLLQISGGSPHRYYRCSTNRKRGAAACSNALSVRESVARDRVLAAIREAIANPAAADYIRKRIAERLGAQVREVDGELEQHSARLARTEERIRGIVLMQLDGDRSPTLATMRADFEAQAATERVAVARLRARASAPIRLPDVAELTRRVLALGKLDEAPDPEAAREVLRRYLRGGVIECSPEGGRYVAKAELLALDLVLGESVGDSPQHLLSSDGCAGRI